jgi:hypothetical protein
MYMITRTYINTSTHNVIICLVTHNIQSYNTLLACSYHIPSGSYVRNQNTTSAKSVKKARTREQIEEEKEKQNELRIEHKAEAKAEKALCPRYVKTHL